MTMFLCHAAALAALCWLARHDNMPEMDAWR
jgi:hypothetical protein